MEDITLRALRILSSVDLILAEDTRVTRKLLGRHGIHTPMESCHAHTSETRIADLAARLGQGLNMALLTDAGTPGVSDPGDRIVDAAVRAGHAVVPVPGASAAAAAVSIAAIPGGRFCFDGFPPRGRSDRREFFENLRNERRAVVLFEAARRLDSTLADLQAAVGARRVLIAREMTKRFEEVFRGFLGEARHWVAETPPRGEYTLVLYPCADKVAPAEPDDSTAALLRDALTRGIRRSEAVRQVSAQTGLPRRAVYAAMLKLTSDEPGDNPHR